MDGMEVELLVGRLQPMGDRGFLGFLELRCKEFRIITFYFSLIYYLFPGRPLFPAAKINDN
jgi:hypothetical protein